MRRRNATLQVREHVHDRALTLALWTSRMYSLPVAVFTVLWLRFLWRWYALILLADDARSFLLLFGLPFVLAGASLVSTTVRLLVGRSVVSLDAMRLSVGDEALGIASGSRLVLPTIDIAEFVVECSIVHDDEGDGARELDGWHVRARLVDGNVVVLPLPVRTLDEANEIATRLNRSLVRARTPQGYRDSLALA